MKLAQAPDAVVFKHSGVTAKRRNEIRVGLGIPVRTRVEKKKVENVMVEGTEMKVLENQAQPVGKVRRSKVSSRKQSLQKTSSLTPKAIPCAAVRLVAIKKLVSCSFDSEEKCPSIISDRFCEETSESSGDDSECEESFNYVVLSRPVGARRRSSHIDKYWDYLGKKMRDKDDGNVYTIQSVCLLNKSVYMFSYYLSSHAPLDPDELIDEALLDYCTCAEVIDCISFEVITHV